MSGLFGGGSQTVTQQPMLTGQQQSLQDWLSQLAQTGSAGGLNLGEAYHGSLGDYNQTDTQRMAGNSLQALLNSAQNNANYGTASSTLTGLANNKFNPDDPSSGYAAYSRAVARAGGVANNAINREAAITGDRYSSSIGRNKADLAAQMNDQLGSKLGDLYNTAQDRSLNASTALGNLTTQQQASQRANIAAGFDPSQGGLQNTLNNAQAQAQYAEFNRQRQEQLQRIGIGQGVFNRNVPFGVMSQTANTPSPFSGLFNAALGAAGTAFGGPFGGMLASGISGLFNSAGNSANGTRSSLDPSKLLGGWGV